MCLVVTTHSGQQQSKASAALLMTYCNGPYAEPDYDLFDDISMLCPLLSPPPAHLVDKLRGSQLSDVAQQVCSTSLTINLDTNLEDQERAEGLTSSHNINVVS